MMYYNIFFLINYNFLNNNTLKKCEKYFHIFLYYNFKLYIFDLIKLVMY